MQTFLYLLPMLVTTLALLTGCARVLPDQDQMPSLATENTSPAAPATVSAAPATLTAATATEPPAPPVSPTIALAPSTFALTPTWAPEAMAAALPGTSQGFELVGHTALEEIGWHAGLAIYGDCAYVGNRRSGGAAIVDISEPEAPTQIGFLPFGPDGQPVELRVLPERALLVAADFGRARLLTFDVADCAAPAPLGALELPAAPHEFYLWHDEERTLVFAALFDHAPPDLLVIDISEPTQPAIVAEWRAEAEGIAGLLHSISLSQDGSRAYLALWNGGVAVADVEGLGLRVLRDNSGAARPAAFVAAHSVVPLQNPSYLLVTSELWRCPFSPVFIVNIADPARPHVVASLALPENRCGELPPGDAVFNPHNPLVVGDLVFLSWYSAGLQALDVSDPLQPERVAQFVPAGEGAAPLSYIGSYAVQTWSYPIVYRGLLYVVDIQSGLYLLRYHGPAAEAVEAIGRAEGNATGLP